MEGRRKILVLVVDDELDERNALRNILVQDGYDVHVAEDGIVGLASFVEHSADVVITDLSMPNMGGFELLTRLRAESWALPIIVATASGDFHSAVSAMRAGADDYLAKPIKIETLIIAIERAVESNALRMEAENLRRQLRDRDGEGLHGLVGSSAPMLKAYRIARQVASARATVLITGESGTGKGELARAIHELGPRKNNSFVSLQCAALTESALESELFGHEKETFSSADKLCVGRFEQAYGGTLFLDEIGEVTMTTQIKLLRVIQERAFDVRLIAATNRDLAADVRDGRFREDLYYRLNVVSIEMAPLRARGGDIFILANHFLRKFAQENHSRIEGFTDAAYAKLLAHRWPGNVRALENVIEGAVALCQNALIDDHDLTFEAAANSFELLRIPGATMAQLERHAILTTLDAVQGSTSKAAEVLDVSVRTIQYRLSEYGAAASETLRRGTTN